MDKQKLIGAIAETKEDQLLLARIWDRLSAGDRSNIPAASCFLSGREQVLARRLMEQAKLPGTFFGGYPGADRAVAVFVPDYYEPEDYLFGPDGPVAALRVTWAADYATLSHRDFLGSLMGQGIKREVLGDLLPGDGSCDILVLREMADYLGRELISVGRARVETAEIPLTELHVPEQQVKEIRDTVASPRLDSILASGFRMGRSKAADAIHAGRAEVNHLPVLKPDAQVAPGDVLSLRGLGKLRVREIGGLTKKGRVSVILERYL